MSVASTAAAAAAVPKKFRYLSAWFCPYAHRCTIALEHHKERGVEYEWIEALGWKKKKTDSHNGTDTSGSDSHSFHEYYYHWKAEELKRVNPSALVPTLIPLERNENTSQYLPNEDHAVFESLVTIDYVDAVSGAIGKDRLNPIDDPYQAARCRIWTEKVNRDCCSPYYGVLVRKDDKERKEHFDKLVAGLIAFSQELSKTSGPTFLADSQLSNVDVALIPWAFRYYVLEHYRGPEFGIPQTISALEKYHTWYDHVMQLESVQRTLPDKDEYLEHIDKYADGSARSKVANAVRRGVAAHDFDDEKDDYEN